MSLPDEIGYHKKLHTSVYDSKSSVFNHHHFWRLIVPETEKILLYKVTQTRDEPRSFTHIRRCPCKILFCCFSVSLFPSHCFFLTLCCCSARICISLKHPWHQPERGVGEKGVGLGCGWIMHFILCQFILMIVQLGDVSRWFISIQCLRFCNSFCTHFKHLGCASGKKDWIGRRLEIFLIYWVGVCFGHSTFFSETSITKQKVF